MSVRRPEEATPLGRNYMKKHNTAPSFPPESRSYHFPARGTMVFFAALLLKTNMAANGRPSYINQALTYIDTRGQDEC